LNITRRLYSFYSDDEWLLDKSEKQISVLTKRDFSFVGGLISRPKDSVLGQLFKSM
jgi:hypothetical protein